jgi:hypothetical protein
MDGDKTAYEQIINRYKDGLYRYCFRFMYDEDEAEAEDIARKTLIEAYVHMTSISHDPSLAHGCIKLLQIWRSYICAENAMQPSLCR